MSVANLKILGPDDLAPVLRRTAETIKVDARRRPESLPPRLRIPGSTKLLWLEQDVLEWLDKCREGKQKRR